MCAAVSSVDRTRDTKEMCSSVAEHEPFRVGPVTLSPVWPWSSLSIAGILAQIEDSEAERFLVGTGLPQRCKCNTQREWNDG